MAHKMYEIAENKLPRTLGRFHLRQVDSLDEEFAERFANLKSSQSFPMVCVDYASAQRALQMMNDYCEQLSELTKERILRV